MHKLVIEGSPHRQTNRINGCMERSGGLGPCRDPNSVSNPSTVLFKEFKRLSKQKLLLPKIHAKFCPQEVAKKEVGGNDVKSPES